MAKEELTKFEGLLNLVDNNKPIDSFEEIIKGRIRDIFDWFKKCNTVIKDLKGINFDLVPKTSVNVSDVVTIKEEVFVFIKGFFFFGDNSWDLAKKGKIEKAIKKAMKGLTKSNPSLIQELIRNLSELIDKIEEFDSELAVEILSIICQLRMKLLHLFKIKQQRLLDVYYFNTLEENRKFSRDMREKLDVFRAQLKPKNT